MANIAEINTNTTYYSPQRAYALGDEYKAQFLKSPQNAQYFLSAKLCYTLPTIKEHPANDSYRYGQNESLKLRQLMEIAESNNNNNSDIVSSSTSTRKALSLLNAFYLPWILEIKPDLMVVGVNHINVEKEGFMEVFEAFKVKYLIKSSLDIDGIAQSMIAGHHQFINEGISKMTDTLTVIYDKIGFKAWCNDVQRDWFKKCDAEFLAICIERVKQMVPTSVLKMCFGSMLLEKEIKFEDGKTTKLIPTSWIFGASASCYNLRLAFTDLMGENSGFLKEEEEGDVNDDQTVAKTQKTGDDAVDDVVNDEKQIEMKEPEDADGEDGDDEMVDAALRGIRHWMIRNQMNGPNVHRLQAMSDHLMHLCATNMRDDLAESLEALPKHNESLKKEVRGYLDPNYSSKPKSFAKNERTISLPKFVLKGMLDELEEYEAMFAPIIGALQSNPK